MEIGTITFPNGRHALVVHASYPPDGPALVRALNLPSPQAVLLLNGGASGMRPADMLRLHGAIGEIARLVAREDIAVIDGGTHAGVIQMIGEGYAAAGGKSPLIGVCPAALVSWPGSPPGDYLTPLEPNHTHFVLTFGHRWGAETETMFALATALSANAPSLAILINGGSIARKEVLHNVRQGREIIVLQGSGRLADLIATTVRGDIAPPDDEIATIAQNGRVTVFNSTGGPEALVALVRRKLFERSSF